MRTTIKVFGIVGIVIGSFAMIGCLSDMTASDAGAGLFASMYFLAWGILSLVYVGQNPN